MLDSDKRINSINKGELVMEETGAIKMQHTLSDLKKWNWGAFMFNIVWGIGNNSYLPLLCLIPLFNIVWIFVCGAKGNQWAWEKGEYSNIDEFMKVQKTWNRAGLVMFLFTVIFVIFYLVMACMLIASVANTM